MAKMLGVKLAAFWSRVWS